MKDFIVEETLKTPSIEFYPSLGTLLIKGKSIPENPVKFYEPLIDLLDQYKESDMIHTKVDFKLEYFNTSSSKCILNLLRKLKGLSSTKNKVTINWFYDEDDEAILEEGEGFSSMLNYTFSFKSIPI